MKTFSIKLEVRDTRFPAAYAVIKHLQDCGEDIPKLFRDWLLREYLSEMLLMSKAEPEEIVQAISSQRRTLMATLSSLDLIEMRCRQLMGQSISIPPSEVTGSVQGSSAEGDEAETETVEDTW